MVFKRLHSDSEMNSSPAGKRLSMGISALLSNSLIFSFNLGIYQVMILGLTVGELDTSIEASGGAIGI